MNNQKIIEILNRFWPRNKAKGLLAQSIFQTDIENGFFGKDAEEKIIAGCWLLAPKNNEFYKFRHSFFIHPEVLKTGQKISHPKDILGNKYRPFHAIAEFMNNAGIGIIYAIPTSSSGFVPYDAIIADDFSKLVWNLFSFHNGSFISINAEKFFGYWEGNRGRASQGNEWDPLIMDKLLKTRTDVLDQLLLNELFYSGYIKKILKKPLNDPYDVDDFLISLSQKHIFPMEVKEKTPGLNKNDNFFGIDAGRILMLMRLCVPNDANSVYLIREVDDKGNFLFWKYITLSDILMSSSWNLQAGGRGMGGQDTQTIRLPYKYFKDFTTDTLNEENLKNIGNLPKEVKSIAKQFNEGISLKFRP